MSNRVIRMDGRGLRGESFADIARTTGAYGVLPTDDDQTVLSKLFGDIEASTMATSNLYPDTTAGIAATTDGDYFSVPDIDDDFLILYRNTSGVAVEVNRYPSKAALAGMATYAALAASGGAGLIGKADGGTVQSYITDFPIRFANGSGSANAIIDATVSGSWVFSSYDMSYSNKLGVNNIKPVDEPATGARSADSGYVTGSADVAAIIAGYDNVNNALAGLIASQHSILYAGADHASIWGGSLHTIHDDADYSVIVGGTSNTIEARGRHAAIIASDQCKLVDNGSLTASGFRGFIAGCSITLIGGRNSAAIGCVGVTLDATYSTALNADTSVISAGNHLLIGGANLTVGSTGLPAFSVIWAEGSTVNASRSLVVGEKHVVSHDYTVATGSGTVPPFTGAITHGTRQRGGVAGNHQTLDFACSQETTDASIVRLSLVGASTYPTQPANSIVTGTCYVTAAQDDGTSAAWMIDFSSVMGPSGSPVIKGQVVTELHDDLTLTDPTINATTGIYRVQVVGLATTNIRWSARFVGHQMVWG